MGELENELDSVLDLYKKKQMKLGPKNRRTAKTT